MCRRQVRRRRHFLAISAAKTPLVAATAVALVVIAAAVAVADVTAASDRLLPPPHRRLTAMAPLAAPICRCHGDRLRPEKDAAKRPPVAAAAGVCVAPATIAVVAVVAAAARRGCGWGVGGREGLVGGAWEGDSTVRFWSFWQFNFVVSSFCVFECTFVMCISKVLNSHDVTGISLTLARRAGCGDDRAGRYDCGLTVQASAHKC